MDSKKNNNRMRIRIKAYDPKIIDEASKKIVEAGLRANVKIVGPIPLPTKRKAFNIKNKTQQRGNPTFENFEMRIHKRLIDIIRPNDKVIEILSSLNLSAGVDVEIVS